MNNSVEIGKEKINYKKVGYLEGIVSIVTNTLLFVIKLWAGILSGSIALIADAWHTLSDSTSSLIVIIGTMLSNQKPDKKHPFGHGRWELIASLFIGILLGIIAISFLKESIIRFRAKESVDFGLVAIVVTITSIAFKEGLAQYAFYLARISDNNIVKADAWHHRSDALSSVIILIGIMLKDYFWWIDSALGFIISVMLFYAVFEIIKESVTKLLGESPTISLISVIKKIVFRYACNDLKPHHFHIHNYVNHKELTFHIKMDGYESIKESHDIATKIENEIREKLNIEASIHIEPNEAE